MEVKTENKPNLFDTQIQVTVGDITAALASYDKQLGMMEAFQAGFLRPM